MRQKTIQLIQMTSTTGRQIFVQMIPQDERVQLCGSVNMTWK